MEKVDVKSIIEARKNEVLAARHALEEAAKEWDKKSYDKCVEIVEALQPFTEYGAAIAISDNSHAVMSKGEPSRCVYVERIFSSALKLYPILSGDSQHDFIVRGQLKFEGIPYTLKEFVEDLVKLMSFEEEQ